VKRKDIKEAVTEFLQADARAPKPPMASGRNCPAKYAYNRKLATQPFR
jgi:hypothetical protein